MTIGEIVQRDVEAAKSLFHNVEHKLADGAREAFHETQVLAASLEAKIVELGKSTVMTASIEAAVKAIVPVLAAIADHVNAVVEPAPAPAKADAPFDPAAQAIMAEPASPAPVALPAEPQVSELIVVPIAAGGSDVTA